MQEGYEFFGKKQLITIFSAPNYCNEFDNLGGVMIIDENLMCSFKSIKSSSEEDDKKKKWKCNDNGMTNLHSRSTFYNRNILNSYLSNKI